MRSAIIILMTVFLVSCGDSEKATEDSNSSKNDKATRDTDYSAEAAWERNKVVKNAQTSIKLGGKDVELNVNNIELNTRGDFDVSEVYVEHGEETHIHIELDLTAILALQLDDTGKVNVSDPDYLELERYPSAFIDVYYPEEPGAKYRLTATLKDKTFEPLNRNTIASWKSGKLEKFESEIVIDGIKHELMNPDIQQTIEADEIVISVKLNQTDNG